MQPTAGGRIMPHKLKARFESVLPRIERHALVMFRSVHCWHTRQDKLQEVRSLCWKWVRQLHKAGKRWWSFVSRLADYACRAVKCGRKIAGSISAKDVMNEITQAQQSFYVGKLPDISTESSNPLSDALIDNTTTEVPDQVAFRIDFPNWVAEHSDRDRSLLTDEALGHRTKDLARQYHMSEGRVSQLRRHFHDSWRQFTDA
jgi:hypothetical protein